LKDGIFTAEGRFDDLKESDDEFVSGFFK
jgi:hypothetical protein